MEMPSDGVYFDADAFDQFIVTHGPKLVHWRAMRCPVGLIDPNDIRRPHEHHTNCSNGFIYTKGGEFHAGFLGNSNEKKQLDMGIADGSTVQIVIPRYYDGAYDADGICAREAEEIELTNYDRVYLAEEKLTVPTWETFQVNASGIDRVQFPVAKVTDLVDNKGKRYFQGVEFDVGEGKLRWRTGLGPAANAVCSVRYKYRPYWYVSRMLHEVRVAQFEDESTGEIKTQRMPMGAQLQREYFFESAQRDKEAKGADVERQIASPPDSIFGPK